MDVISLYTNIPQDDGITVVCEAYEKYMYHNNSPPIPSRPTTLNKYSALYSKNVRSSSTEKTQYLQVHGMSINKILIYS